MDTRVRRKAKLARRSQPWNAVVCGGDEMLTPRLSLLSSPNEPVAPSDQNKRADSAIHFS